MASKDLLLRVAKLSFVDRKKNNEIAAALRKKGILKAKSNTSRVQKLIDEAGQWLLQEHERLSAIENASLNSDLADALRTKYDHLLDARVVRSGPVRTTTDYARLRRKMAKAAADYFDELADNAEQQEEKLYVGVGGGQTVLEVVTSLPERTRPHVYFYPSAIIGRGDITDLSSVGPETNATIAWGRSGWIQNRLHYGTVTPFQAGSLSGNNVENARKQIAEELDYFSELPGIARLLRKMSDVNVAIAGLGPIRPSEKAPSSAIVPTLYALSVLHTLGIKAELLAQEGVVGSLSYCLFDENGEGPGKWNFFLTAGYPNGVDHYRRMVAERRPVVVVGGPYKEVVIRTALKAKLFNVLITDELTAKGLLKS